MSKPELSWKCQAHRHPLTGKPLDPDYPNPIYHFGSSRVGTFEIFENDGLFLLSFPRSMNLPAELFHDLSKAQDHAAQSIRNRSGE